MNPTPTLISVADRVQETPETWSAYISAQQWGDQIPHLQDRDDGSQFWVVAGQPLDDRPLAETGALMPDRNHNPQRWDDVPPAAYDPAQRIRAMDADGVDAQALYPSVAGGSGEVLGAIADPELQLACVQAYNNWLIDAWAKKSPRFIPQCLVPINDPNAAATEAARAIERGHRGVILPGTPWDLQDVPHVNDPAWDPLWNVCQDSQVPICFHSGATQKLRLQAWDDFSPVLTDAINAITAPSAASPSSPTSSSPASSPASQPSNSSSPTPPSPGAPTSSRPPTTSLNDSDSTTKATTSNPPNSSAASAT